MEELTVHTSYNFTKCYKRFEIGSYECEQSNSLFPVIFMCENNDMNSTT